MKTKQRKNSQDHANLDFESFWACFSFSFSEKMPQRYGTNAVNSKIGNETNGTNTKHDILIHISLYSIKFQDRNRPSLDRNCELEVYDGTDSRRFVE